MGIGIVFSLYFWTVMLILDQFDSHVFVEHIQLIIIGSPLLPCRAFVVLIPDGNKAKASSIQMNMFIVNTDACFQSRMFFVVVVLPEALNQKISEISFSK